MHALASPERCQRDSSWILSLWNEKQLILICVSEAQTASPRTQTNTLIRIQKTLFFFNASEVIAAHFDHYHHIWFWILNWWCERRVKCICAEILYNNASFLVSWCRYQGQSIPSLIRSNAFRSLGKNSSTYAHYHRGWVPCVQYLCWLWCWEKLTCGAPPPPPFFSFHLIPMFSSSACLHLFSSFFHSRESSTCFRPEINAIRFFNIKNFWLQFLRNMDAFITTVILLLITFQLS